MKMITNDLREVLVPFNEWAYVGASRQFTWHCYQYFYVLGFLQGAVHFDLFAFIASFMEIQEGKDESIDTMIKRTWYLLIQERKITVLTVDSQMPLKRG